MARPVRRRFVGLAGTTLVLAVVAVVVLVGGGSRAAFAHASLESSAPAANSVLEAGPDSIVLDFNEGVEAELASISLFDGDGSVLQVGTPKAGGDDTIVSVIAPQVGDGIYAVVWRVTSSDGHVVDGAFSFQVGTGGTGDGQQLIDQVRDGVRSQPAVRWWYGAARFLSLAGAIALLGAGWWLLQAPALMLARRGAKVLIAVAAVALGVGSAAAFGLFGAEAVAGTLADAASPSVWADVAGTQTGRMLLARVVFAVVLVGLLGLRARRAWGWWRLAAAAAGIFTLYTFPAAGHPNGQDPAALWITLDLAHLVAITIWLGGLLALAVSSSAALASPEGGRLVRRFSMASAIAVPVIVASGVAQALKLAGGIADLTETDWGRLLLTKVTVVVALLALAGVSRWLLRHDGTASIRRTVIAEAMLGVVVVGLAAGMVALPPRPQIEARPFAQQLSSQGLIAVISLSPGVVGSNEMHIVMTPPGGSITPVVNATARVSLASALIPASPVTLTREGPNHYSGLITFPRGGDWTFELIVQLTETQSILFTSTVPIP